ncbi:sugar ABC transporter substrate-binding protein [Alkaliphilus hydrothermalis]|uniref:Maltodextrin-binding protein n=1 Tax=Alkaliphilus hydrothermalis TaxID=1482730 RepID=A0ABS2NSV4_9FIRM|nr:maltose ABC transporter substrate-binding protein [Alkaliphilus hydrothermalis]MBM7615654.1 maltose-binding protein MalE [Alkaliphilus hydrothermalis]
MQRRYKKLISLVFLAAMAIMVLGGCTQSSNTSAVEKFNPDEVVALNVWHGWSGEEEAALVEATKQFTAKYPNVTFNLLYTPFEGGYKDKLKASLQTGDGPDLFFGPHDWTGEFAVGNLIDAIDGYVKEVKSEYVESTYEAAAFNKKHYGFPLSMDAVVLIYNKDLVPQAPKSISEMLEIAKANTQGENWGLSFDYNGIYYFTHAFFSGFGNKIFKDDEGTPDFNNENFVAYLDFLHQLKNEDKVMPKSLDYGTAMALFTEGKSAFLINGPWAFGDLDKSGVNWGATIIPKNDIANNESKPFMGVKMAFLPRMAENKGAAAEFAKFVASAEMAKLFNEKVGVVPANNKVEFNRDTDKLIQEQAANAIAMPAIPEMAQVWEPVKDAIEAVVDSNKDATEVAKNTQEEIEKAIKEARGE